jgi:hypothetical protein
MEIKLEPGDVICDRCNGHGVMTHTVQKKKNFFVEKTVCDKCHGECKLDWIENVRGKEKKESRYHESGMKYGAKKIKLTWSYEIPELEPKWKKSSREIIESIDPKARKRLERKIAYNLSR